MPKRYALLVGIDLYMHGSERRLDEERHLVLSNLRGCVNDVESMRDFLDKVYEFDNVSALTSSVPDDASDEGGTMPAEPADQWPTYENIRAGFDDVYDRAAAGDFFFFHFSGHGARLKRVPGSPKERLQDPSLLTVDFCRGYPAIRGWQLNRWLRRMNRKGIQVVVTLDSCHSGGSWRAGGSASFRTPNNWSFKEMPNLLLDEQAAASEAPDEDNEPTHRDADLEVSWSINPDSFTLLAACGSDEKAAESVRDGKAGGAFTHELLDVLRKEDPAAVTYRMIRDRLKSRLTEQTPAVYGRDRLLFFTNSEPFAAVPLVATVQDGKLIIPVGLAHGVNMGSEFAPFQDKAHLALCVDEVDDFECSAALPVEDVRLLKQHGPTTMVVPSRWHLGEAGATQIFMDPAFGSTFQNSLQDWLKCRIASDVDIVEQHHPHEADSLWLSRRDGAQPEIWNNGQPVGPLSLVGDRLEDLAAEVASPLAHLIRFRQVLHLRPQDGYEDPGPFEVHLRPANGAVPNSGLYPLTQKFKFIFENKDEEELYFTVIIFTPEYSIQQLYPPSDQPQPIAEGKRKIFNFSMKLPSGPPWVEQALCRTRRRDIIRTLVTRGKRVSWKSLELPNIWDASKIKQYEKKQSTGRDASLDSGCEWWVHDEEVVTGEL